MKYEERLTQWVAGGASLILDTPTTAEEARQQVMVQFKKACTKLAEFEDKIESGELVERTSEEYSAVRKQDVEVCKEVVKECLQVLRDMRVVLGIYDDYLLGWNDGINESIDRLAKKYCIDEEDRK